MLESGVLKYGDKFMKGMEKGEWNIEDVDAEALKKSQIALVFGQMNEPPGARLRVALSGLTVAEQFRDQDGGSKDILLFIDNIFRFTQAGSEVSALLGRMPSAVAISNACVGDGRSPGANHVDEAGFHHIGSGNLCAGR